MSAAFAYMSATKDPSELEVMKVCLSFVLHIEPALLIDCSKRVW